MVAGALVRQLHLSCETRTFAIGRTSSLVGATAVTLMKEMKLAIEYPSAPGPPPPTLQPASLVLVDRTTLLTGSGVHTSNLLQRIMASMSRAAVGAAIAADDDDTLGSAAAMVARPAYAHDVTAVLPSLAHPPLHPLRHVPFVADGGGSWSGSGAAEVHPVMGARPGEASRPLVALDRLAPPSLCHPYSANATRLVEQLCLEGMREVVVGSDSVQLRLLFSFSFYESPSIATPNHRGVRALQTTWARLMR